jgi:hypothetical protein
MPTERFRDEASHIYRALFGGEAPESLRRLYTTALETSPLAPWPQIDVCRLAAEGADLEAIELALRWQEPRNALSQRFQVMTYLAEVRVEHYGTFINDERWFVRGILALAMYVGQSFYKWLKGRRLLKIHGIG